ncbi:hypothetical protein SAY87_003841 [Trapa incisa]|uniref:TOD1/MUCI70 glycosyltransferase-like domain-containing protein n=1 Tax=Trapa incisa TaxID=236973 RepID=A0AAN7KS26_9MYRT|nr:hypothetical protein SAY87_003841 [Trapa incisa]
MFSNKGVTISISDDEADELGRLRARARRKRKKHNGPRIKAEWTRRIKRLLIRYWFFLLLVPAIGLLLYEASRIGRGTSNADNRTTDAENVRMGFDSQIRMMPSLDKRSEGNLNRLDPTTRVIGGVRERCLKLLPPEEIQLLVVSTTKESLSPIKNVIYISRNEALHEGGEMIIPEQQTEATRFNMFTGNQTSEQRDESFKVNETVQVHCGFYSQNGGFNISNEDKLYMETCQVVVATCAFGGGDDLYQPIGMEESSFSKVCYVAFWDSITLHTQESEGHMVGQDRTIGKWRIVVVNNLPFTDQRLNGKIPKMLGHRLFPHAKYSIWVDSKSQFRRDPMGVLEALLWRSNSVLAISEHGARSSVYDEAKAVVKKNKATPEEVEIQMTQYHIDGLPEDKRFNGKKALSEASVIVREHTPITNLFMCLWFNEVVRFTSRDQLSFPYVLWRLKVLKNINMFPVCTRKDLVNSMGHIRKAKPLMKAG